MFLIYYVFCIHVYVFPSTIVVSLWILHIMLIFLDCHLKTGWIARYSIAVFYLLSYKNFRMKQSKWNWFGKNPILSPTLKQNWRWHRLFLKNMILNLMNQNIVIGINKEIWYATFFLYFKICLIKIHWLMKLSNCKYKYFKIEVDVTWNLFKF